MSKKVLTVMVEGNTEIVEMEGLKEYQSFVGGYIEMPHISRKLNDKKIDIIINEEGKLIGLKPTFAIVNEGRVIDLICGNAIFVSHDTHGRTKSLSGSQIKYLMENVLNNRGFLSVDGEVVDVGIIEV